MFNYQRVLYKQSNFGGLVLNAYDEFGQTMVNEGKRHRLNFRLTTYWMLDLSTTKLDSNNDRPLGYSLIAKKILIHQEKCGYAKLLGTMVTENRLNLWMFPQKSPKMVLSFDHPGIWLWAIEAIDTSTGWIYTVCLEQNLWTRIPVSIMSIFVFGDCVS